MKKNKSDTWDPLAYSQFLNLRTLPARDLLSAIPSTFQPKTVYDLGCGPGNSTILLKERWPQAKIVGLDLSLDMLNAAKTNYPEIEFIPGDIAQFTLFEKIDAIFANASLQWIDNHQILLPKLLSFLNPNGILAVQMPNNFHSPTHQITIQILQQHPQWHHLLKKLHFGVLTKPLFNLAWYYDLLIQIGVRSIQLWETQYFQEMDNYHEIFAWAEGTSLRPILTHMDNKNCMHFEKAYVDSVSKAYDAQHNGKILLPFSRIFIVVAV